MLIKPVFILAVLVICLSFLMAIFGHMGVFAKLVDLSFYLLCLGLVFYLWSLYDNKK